MVLNIQRSTTGTSNQTWHTSQAYIIDANNGVSTLTLTGTYIPTGVNAQLIHMQVYNPQPDVFSSGNRIGCAVSGYIQAEYGKFDTRMTMNFVVYPGEVKTVIDLHTPLYGSRHLGDLYGDAISSPELRLQMDRDYAGTTTGTEQACHVYTVWLLNIRQ
jgi:hypothetical protein